ncbi:MAG: ribose ABC transporter substrate-binding protein, partial [Alphaproteobacteria bacterium HGW-Alphaproteobacteria-8]
MKRLTLTTSALALCFAANLASAQTLPLKALPDDGERNFWWYHQVQDPAKLEALQAVV